MKHKRRDALVLGGIGLFIVALVAFLVVRVQRGLAPAGITPPTATKPNEKAPQLTRSVVMSGLSNVWDIGFLPDDTLIFTERAGTISRIKDGQKLAMLGVPGVQARGEGGLMGLAVDPDFPNNRFIYACYNTARDIRVSRWKVTGDGLKLTDQKDIVTGMPVNTTTFPGRHSGCRPRFGADGQLWIGTGDIAMASNSQDPKSLGGKILRVTRDGGPSAGNPGGVLDPRIYSHGHRNVQGLAMYQTPKNGLMGYSVEHGPSRDDEVDKLVPGNMGWAPTPTYNESVPMTNKQAYPDANEPIWTSGDSTIAPSGMTFITGEKWQIYNGRLAMAVLKDKHLRLLELDDQGKLKSEEVLLQNEFGRIRSAVMGPLNDLYLTTDNGAGQDMIVRVAPR